MQNEEQREKLDEVSRLIGQFCELAYRLGQKFKVSSPPFPVEDGSFQVLRSKGTWELMWIEEKKEQELRSSTIAVKRRFLVVARDFFKNYVGVAENWEKTVDQDIEKGREALEEVKKLIA